MYLFGYQAVSNCCGRDRFGKGDFPELTVLNFSW